MENINVAVIGYGQRGKGNLQVILNSPDVTVTAVSDSYADRCEEAAEAVVKHGGKKPFATTDYTQILGRSDVDVVFVFTSWETHMRVAIDAMKAKHAVGLEVGGAYSIQECWELVDTYEKTKVPFMLLENCCYGRTEMMLFNMVNDGLFGELVHCHGAYAHDLRDEILTGKEIRHYRLRNYINRNCENYPTHELGPIAKMLKVNRGNRMLSLVSVSSKAAGLKQWVNDRGDTIVNKDLIGMEFRQGDIVNTIITCSGGETISLKLDTTLPRAYSRELCVHGTKGMFEENTNSIFLDGDTNHDKITIDSAKKYEEKYLPDCWKEITDEIIEAGHGGMDYFSFQDFFKRLRERREMPMDVYDAAAWMSISCLSEQSIACGSARIDIPDFTNGMWLTRK